VHTVKSNALNHMTMQKYENRCYISKVYSIITITISNKEQVMSVSTSMIAIIIHKPYLVCCTGSIKAWFWFLQNLDKTCYLPNFYQGCDSF